MQVIALTYSLQDIIKEKRYLNNPERKRDLESNYSYFLLQGKYVLKFNNKKKLTWSMIKDAFFDSGIISFFPDPITPNDYVVHKTLSPEIEKQAELFGMAFCL